MARVAVESASPGSPVSGTGRGRRRGALALVVIASLLVCPALLAIWVDRQVLDTERWTRTSTELLENRLIRDQVATFLVDRLYENVDVESELRHALPPRLQPLAGPAAGGLRDLSERTARNVLARPRAQARWADANRVAHVALLRLLEGGGENVSTEGGVVVLDVRSLLALLTERVGVGGRVQRVLPASAARITVLRSEQLETAQTGLKVLQGLPYVLVGLSFALFAGALALAPDWRRQALRAYGVGFIAAGGATLVACSVAGNQLVAALGSTASVQPAIAAGWDIATPLLEQAAKATVLYGAVMVAGAWLAGPTRLAVAIRASVAPYVRNPAVAYAGLALVVVLVLAWGPTPATRNPALAILLVVLMVIGTEALRRKILREHPDARRGASMRRARAAMGATAQRSVAWARQGTAAGRAALTGTAARVTAARAGGAGSDASDARIGQLERLSKLKEAGVLDDEEFRAEKRKILEEPPDEEPQPAAADGEAPARV